MEENTRLSDLTRMLLSSPSFSGFLDTLTPNITTDPQAAPVAAPAERPAETRQIKKDINPYAVQQQMQTQQINMTLIPEHTMDFSILDLNGDGSYSYQPQVFSVLSMPEVAIDSSVLSGKSSNFVRQSFESDDEKVEIPIIERMPTKTEDIPEPTTVDEEFDSDPTFALFSQLPTPARQTPTNLELAPLFGGIESEKVFTRYELVTTTNDTISALDMARIERLFSSLDVVAARLESMTKGL
jgi:bZIP-type transcription factor MBZ1